MEQQLIESTLGWLREVAESARAEAKAGNLGPINALSANPVMQYYIHNVSSGLLKEQEYAMQFPKHIQDAAELRKRYDEAAAAGDLPQRVGKLEEAISTLPEKIAAALKEAGISVNVTESEPPDPAVTTEVPPVPPADPAPVKPAPVKPGKKPADPAPATPPTTDPVPPVGDEDPDKPEA